MVRDTSELGAGDRRPVEGRKPPAGGGEGGCCGGLSAIVTRLSGGLWSAAELSDAHGIFDES